LDDCRLTHIVDTLDNESLLGDRHIMNGVLRRLPESLEQVYKRYGTVLKSIIMQVLHNEAEAEDVLQEVFLQVWDRAPSYCSEKGTLVAWLCTIARRRAIDRLRQQNAYLHATDRCEVSCQSSNGFNESHPVECEDPRFEIMRGTKARGAEVKADPYEALPRQTIAEQVVYL